MALEATLTHLVHLEAVVVDQDLEGSRIRAAQALLLVLQATIHHPPQHHLLAAARVRLGESLRLVNQPLDQVAQQGRHLAAVLAVVHQHSGNPHLEQAPLQTRARHRRLVNLDLEQGQTRQHRHLARPPAPQNLRDPRLDNRPLASLVSVSQPLDPQTAMIRQGPVVLLVSQPLDPQITMIRQGLVVLLVSLHLGHRQQPRRLDSRVLGGLHQIPTLLQQEQQIQRLQEV